jgi:hypothetical protein
LWCILQRCACKDAASASPLRKILSSRRRAAGAGGGGSGHGGAADSSNGSGHDGGGGGSMASSSSRGSLDLSSETDEFGRPEHVQARPHATCPALSSYCQSRERPLSLATAL